jgi:hypothetical protein
MEKQPAKKSSTSQDSNSTLPTEVHSDDKSGSLTTGQKSLEEEEEEEEELKKRLNRTARLYYNVKKYTQLEDHSARGRWRDDEEEEKPTEAAAGEESSFHALLRQKRDEKIAKFISLGWWTDSVF